MKDVQVVQEAYYVTMSVITQDAKIFTGRNSVGTQPEHGDIL